MVYCFLLIFSRSPVAVFERDARPHHLAPDDDHAVRDSKDRWCCTWRAPRGTAAYLTLLRHRHESRDTHYTSFCKRMIVGSNFGIHAIPLVLFFTDRFSQRHKAYPPFGSVRDGTLSQNPIRYTDLVVACERSGDDA